VSVVSGNNVKLVASGGLPFGTSTVSGWLEGTSGGAISQNGKLTVTGAVWLASGGNISLGSIKNALGSTVSLIAPLSNGSAGGGGSVALYADAIRIGTAGNPSTGTDTRSGIQGGRVTLKIDGGGTLTASGSQGLITADEPQAGDFALTLDVPDGIPLATPGNPKAEGLWVKTTGKVRVIPDSIGPNKVWLFGDDAFQPKYEGSGDLSKRAVLYNGVEATNAQLTGALDAAYLDIRNATTEVRESGFAKENASKVLRRGVVTSAGPGQPAVDDSTGMAGAEECEGGFADGSLSCQ
jgi:hypothetical protein